MKNVKHGFLNSVNLTEIYEKIKDKPSIPTFDSQDSQEWKNFKTNLAAIDWTEVIF